MTTSTPDAGEPTGKSVDFTEFVDLASRALGAGVVAANDEWFAEKENLLRPHAPTFTPHTFGPKGQIMDGWETRRRRGTSAEHPHVEPDDHDWAITRLGVPGVIPRRRRRHRALHRQLPALRVDRGGFGARDALGRGNCSTRRSCGPRSSRASTCKATPRTTSTSTSPYRFTHVRLNIFPDGGIAPTARARRGVARSRVARRPHRRSRGPGVRRRRRGRERPLLLVAAQHQRPRPLTRHGRGLGDASTSRRRQRLGTRNGSWAGRTSWPPRSTSTTTWGTPRVGSRSWAATRRGPPTIPTRGSNCSPGHGSGPTRATASGSPTCPR